MPGTDGLLFFLVEDAPGQIQRTITGGPFKIRHWRMDTTCAASALDAGRG